MPIEESGSIRKLQGDKKILWLSNSNGEHHTRLQLWALPLMLFGRVHILLHAWTSVALRRILFPVSHPLLYRFSSPGAVSLRVCLCSAWQRKVHFELLYFFSKKCLVITPMSAEYSDNSGSKTCCLRWDFGGTRKTVLMIAKLFTFPSIIPFQ